ncbi:MAG: pseudouridine synthase [Myxococcota bacterium]|nr:pseudouridine synthase [Myxococcota bacterium]
MKPDHLVKILAERGVSSRRGSERMIRDGLVSVDGTVVTEPGLKVDPRAQKILVEDKPLPGRPRRVYMVIHKPKGVINSRLDPEGRRTVYELLDGLPPGVETVGRLDYGSEGVLLMTNDGEMSYRLTHPSYGVTKSYLVKVSGTPDERKLALLARGVHLDDGPTSPARVEMISSVGPSTWLLLTIHEGRNRIVRRLISHVGHRVLKLKRVGFGGITLRGLKVGESRSLTAGELAHLRRLVKEPGPPVLKVSHAVRKGVADALGLAQPPKQERVRPKARDEEGRPYRKKGWARPGAKKSTRSGGRSRRGASRVGSARPNRSKKQGGGRGGSGRED